MRHSLKSLCFTLLFLVYLQSCNSTTENSIRFGVPSAPLNLDPRYATDAVSSRINRLIYQRLVDFKNSYNAQPALADWHKLSPTHYRFKLRKHNNEFHNGSRLTTEDVKATYEFVLDDRHGSPHRSSISIIDAIKIIDDRTIDFLLNKADVLFPHYMVLGILPENLLRQGYPFNENPIGSGEFEFLGWRDDSRLRLKRLKDNQIIEIVVIRQPTVRVLKLIRGEIDITQNELPGELLSYLGDQQGIVIHREPGTTFSYLGFNLQDKIVGQHQIRLAIAHAIDRRAIIKHLFFGAARLASSLLPPEHWAGNSQLPELDYNPHKARELLAELGYGPEHPIKIDYKTSSDPFRIRLATLYQHQLAKIGIILKIQSYDWGTFYGDIKSGNFQMYSLSWVGVKTPDIFRFVFHSHSIPPNGANRGRFIDPEVDELINRAQIASTTELQSNYYRRIQTLLLSRLPYVPLWFEGQYFVANDKISNYKLNLYGNYDGLNNIQRDN